VERGSAATRDGNSTKNFADCDKKSTYFKALVIPNANFNAEMKAR
jgi:hypothetical protein